ncbi:hypothetical protein WJX72_008965 [[Myrmecia] bisecta]|uniref:Trichohyalin-plectin-homology domain-containing protein n=1 Tax=[Myrmecia] bisecta TaxID=41462 RepID=A0AAW1PDA2_9CHLO
MSSVTIITRAQLESMRSKAQPEQDCIHTSDRKHLKELSDARAARWPNTLEAQRARKLRAHQDRLAAQEAERKAEDERDAALKAEMRRVQIESANKMLYDDTDKAKSFHSKLLLSDVMKEREAQIDYKHKIAALNQYRDEIFLKKMHVNLKEEEEKEKLKLDAIKQKALAQRDVQLSQLEDLKCRILADREQNRLEGLMIRQKAIEEAAELKRKEESVRERAKRANFETKKANEILQSFKQLDKQRERDVEAQIEAYAAKKAELAEERRRREGARADAKEARRQAMVDIMERIYMQFKNENDARLARDIKAAEDKADADAAERARIRREEWESIDRSRQNQLQRKKEATEEQKAEERAFARDWEARLAELKAEEAAEAAELLARNRQHVAFLQRQINQKHSRRSAQQIQEEQEDLARRFNIQDDGETFRQYATVCIEEWARQGKDTKPLEMYLKASQKTSVTK